MYEEIRIDNTQRKTAVQCKRKFQLQHILGIQSIYGSTALRFGSAWHGMLEGYYATIKELGWTQYTRAIEVGLARGKEVWDRESALYTYYDDYRTFENCAQAFLQYISFYDFDSTYTEVLETEQVFSMELSRETWFEEKMFSSLPRIIFTGKVDLKVSIAGNKWIMEHKTSAQNPGFISSRLHRNTAVIGYTYAGERLFNEKLEGVLVNIVQVSARKSKTTGEYGKLTVDFGRHPQLFTDADFEKWKHSFLRTCRDITECWLDGYFPAEFDSCYDYNKLCPYSAICETNKTIPLDPDDAEGFISGFQGYLIKKWDVEHEEE